MSTKKDLKELKELKDMVLQLKSLTDPALVQIIKATKGEDFDEKAIAALVEQCLWVMGSKE